MLRNSDAAPMAALLAKCPEEHQDRLRLLWQSELMSKSEVTKRTMLPPMTCGGSSRNGLGDGWEAWRSRALP